MENLSLLKEMKRKEEEGIEKINLGKKIDLFTDTAAILNSEEIMGCPGGR